MEQARVQQTQNQQAAQGYGNEDKCPVCGGSGWELIWKETELYGGEKAQFARRCRQCSSKLQNEDFTRVPPQFRDADIGRFNFEAYSANTAKLKRLALSVVNDFGKWDKAGKGLYLWSQTPGSGKTFLACCLAKSVMIKHNLQMRFVAAPDYMAAVGASYKRERGECDESEVFRKCKVLIMDDIGAQMGKEWQQQEMFRIVNERLSEGNVTIYTSNMPPEKLNLEERTIDRIIKSSVVIQMPEEGIRQRKAKDEQERFLREIVGM